MRLDTYCISGFLQYWSPSSHPKMKYFLLEETVKLSSWEFQHKGIVGANNNTGYFCFYMVRVQTNCSISAGWAKSVPKFAIVIICCTVTFMLAIYWEFLGTFINTHCVFLQVILLGLKTEWLFIDIFVLFIHFSLMMQSIILSFSILWIKYIVHFFLYT